MTPTGALGAGRSLRDYRPDRPTTEGAEHDGSSCITLDRALDGGLALADRHIGLPLRCAPRDRLCRFGIRPDRRGGRMAFDQEESSLNLQPIVANLVARYLTASLRGKPSV